MARPLKVTDHQVFEATLELALDEGLEACSLDRLAKDLSVQRSTLTNRFGNRIELLRRVDAHYLAMSENLLVQAAKEHTSPLDAVLHGLSSEMRFATTAARYNNGLALLLLCMKDPIMFTHYQNALRRQADQLESLLKTARDQGLLAKNLDCKSLARQLQIVQQGACHTWMMAQSNDSLPTYIMRQLRMYISAYTSHSTKLNLH